MLYGLEYETLMSTFELIHLLHIVTREEFKTKTPEIPV